MLTMVWKLIISLKLILSKDFPKNMKTQRKRIEIISETTTLLILKNSNAGARQSWCEQCAAEVFWIAPTEIELFGISDLPKSGAIHTNGDFVCSRSLFEEIKKGEKL